MANQQKQFILPEQLGNALLQYLSTKPYSEVAGLIQAISILQEFKPLPESPERELQKED